MEALQRGLPGAHAQSQHTVCKVFPNEPVLALIPLQLMAEMTVWDCQQRVKIAPPKQMDAQVRRLCSTYQGKRGLKRVPSPTLHIVFLCFDMMNTLKSLKVCLDIVSVFLFIQSRNDEVILPVLYTRSCLTARENELRERILVPHDNFF